MTGTGTIINAAAIVCGGIFGTLFGRFLDERKQETLIKASGISVMFLALGGAMEGMLAIDGGRLTSGGGMLITISLALGALIGEALDIEQRLEDFGIWLREKTGNSKDAKFIDGFVTATLTVCIGAMAIMGAIRDGLFGDWSILAAKATLDFIIITVMTSSLGKGCAFSAIPVAALQGSVTAAAGLAEPLMTPAALANLSLVGSILIFCVGMNLVWKNTVRVANLLPSLVIAVMAAFL